MGDERISVTNEAFADRSRNSQPLDGIECHCCNSMSWRRSRSQPLPELRSPRGRSAGDRTCLGTNVDLKSAPLREFHRLVLQVIPIGIEGPRSSTAHSAGRRVEPMSNESSIEFRLEVSADRFQPYMWTSHKTGRDKLASSETYTSRNGAINAVHAVQAGEVSYDVVQGEDNWWYFHVQARNSRILARSAFKYRVEVAAEADKEVMRVNAAKAPFWDYTKAA